MSQTLIKTNKISKFYKMGQVTVKALQEVSFEVYQGEFVVILGPSGSGKSTLLNIIGGMDTPSEGKAFFLEKEITSLDERQLTEYRRYQVGFVFQFYNLMANLTAKENVELATEITKDPLDIEEVMNSVSLGERMDHFPAQMSGGEQQRVAIARAVAKNPLVLLCDEPTGALDYETGKKILKLLKDINKDFAKAVIVITHNVAIGEIADRVVKMRSGKITENYTNDNPVDPEKIEW